VCVCVCVCRARAALSRRLHQIKASVEEKKLALTDQISFVLARPYYLILYSLYLAKRSSAVTLPFFISFKRFAGPPILPLLPTSSARGQSLLSYRNLSCTSSIFLETISLLFGRGNRPNADAARAQRSPRLSSPGTYVFLLHLQSETLLRR